MSDAPIPTCSIMRSYLRGKKSLEGLGVASSITPGLILRVKSFGEKQSKIHMENSEAVWYLSK